MDSSNHSSELKISSKPQEAAASVAIPIKPRNYFNELSPERQEEHRKLEAMITEAERYKKIAEAVDMFESFQRRLKAIDNSKRVKPKAESKPLLEEVLITRGLLCATRIQTQKGTSRNE